VGWCYAELYRLRGVFLTAMGAEETQIEASFGEAIRIAKEQKNVTSLLTRGLLGGRWVRSVTFMELTLQSDLEKLIARPAARLGVTKPAGVDTLAGANR
jgi:hypothetical protein